jgi:hypothetical protein
MTISIAIKEKGFIQLGKNRQNINCINAVQKKIVSRNEY